jgi:hypothetical protein
MIIDSIFPASPATIDSSVAFLKNANPYVCSKPPTKASTISVEYLIVYGMPIIIGAFRSCRQGFGMTNALREHRSVDIPFDQECRQRDMDDEKWREEVLSSPKRQGRSPVSRILGKKRLY